MHSRLPALSRFSGLLFLVALTFTLNPGCDTMPLPGDISSASGLKPVVSDNGVADASTDPSAQNSANGIVNESTSDNSSLDRAQPAALTTGVDLTLEGTIDSINDMDFYALGAATLGERVTIDVAGRDGLNTVAALFDGNGDLIDANDDRSYYGGKLDPFIVVKLRESTPNLLLGIAVSGGGLFASNQGRSASGSYSVRVRRDSDATILQPRQQIVWLDFEGGKDVQIALEAIEHMRPFSAASISSRLAGKDDYIINIALEKIAQDYAPYDVVLLDSRHHTRPTVPHTELYFGNFSQRFLGLADNVDTGNAALQQEAIIYTETLSMFETLKPSAEEVGQAIGNVAAHELGHLLGLEHTSDAQDIMATAATARQVLEVDATFTRANLNSAVFPTGHQNNPVLLTQHVGLRHGGSARVSLVDVVQSNMDTSFRDQIDPSLIPMVPMCSHHDHE